MTVSTNYPRSAYTKEDDHLCYAFAQSTRVKGERLMDAYIVGFVHNWRDPKTNKVFEAAALVRGLSPFIPASEVRQILEDRRFVQILCRPNDKHFSHMLADKKWHKMLTDPQHPTEVVFLYDDDDEGERVEGNVGCSIFDSSDFDRQAAEYKVFFKIDQPSGLIAFIKGIARSFRHKKDQS
ncbi:MAG: hypothetical protein ACSNEK_10405 [Parachlamydiaceae bacterium]